MGPMPEDLPIPYGPISNGEFDPVAAEAHIAETVRRTEAAADSAARRLGMGRREFLRTVCGSAAALLVLGACSRDSGNGDGGTYDVPEEAALDPDAAFDALGGDEFVFDVQTHLLDFELLENAGAVYIGGAFPQAQCGEDDDRLCFSLDTYLEELFLRSDTNLAVISALPIPGDANPLPIETMAEARDTADALCGDERLFLHGQAMPSTGPLQAALDGMDELVSEYPVRAWKVYTHVGGEPFFLDDHDPAGAQVGNAFLDKIPETGVTTLCVHKGFAGIGGGAARAPFASPVDIGPAARDHPEVDIVVYHSGFDFDAPEGPYTPATADVGVNRLISSLEAAEIAPGSNVYAELGGTWYFTMQNPDAAAHVLGKLLLAVGEDRVVWGTDSIWFGSPQSQLEAFRAFEISEEFQETYGYPALTEEIKAKILGLNSAALYGVEPVTTRCDFSREDLAELRVALPPSPRTYGPETASEVRALAASHGWIGF